MCSLSCWLSMCVILKLIVGLNGYVLLAGDVEDFRNIARKLVPEPLADKLARIASNKQLKQKTRLDKEQSDYEYESDSEEDDDMNEREDHNSKNYASNIHLEPGPDKPVIIKEMDSKLNFDELVEKVKERIAKELNEELKKRVAKQKYGTHSIHSKEQRETMDEIKIGTEEDVYDDDRNGSKADASHNDLQTKHFDEHESPTTHSEEKTSNNNAHAAGETLEKSKLTSKHNVFEQEPYGGNNNNENIYDSSQNNRQKYKIGSEINNTKKNVKSHFDDELYVNVDKHTYEANDDETKDLLDDQGTYGSKGVQKNVKNSKKNNGNEGNSQKYVKGHEHDNNYKQIKYNNKFEHQYNDKFKDDTSISKFEDDKYGKKIEDTDYSDKFKGDEHVAKYKEPKYNNEYNEDEYHDKFKNDDFNNKFKDKMTLQNVPNHDSFLKDIKVDNSKTIVQDDKGAYDQFELISKGKNDSYEDYLMPNKEGNIFESDESAKATSNRDYGKKEQINFLNDKKYKKSRSKTKQKNDLDNIKPFKNDWKNEHELKKRKPTQSDEETREKIEEVKAKTESLWFNDDGAKDRDNTDYLKASGSKVKTKGTMIPRREVYKVISPNYYISLPTVAEKYDPNEPLPERDRERQIIKHFINPHDSINKKVRLL